jgi:hypothetical protein
MLHIVNPPRLARGGLWHFVNWQVGGAEDSPSQVSRKAIRAELTGSDACTACGITSRSSSPVLALCRKLVQAGHDPATPLEAYKGDTLCLRVRSIGEGARLQVNSLGRGFEPYQGPRPAPPTRKNERAP